MSALRPVDVGGARHLLSVGEVEGLVSAELIAEFRLVPGRVISASEAPALTAAVHRLQVFDQAVSLLSARARSARDLTQALRRRGATAEECEAAVARLVELQLLDDGSYARNVARAKASGGGMSRRRIQQELIRRGVTPGLAREAIGEVVETDGLDEFGAALAVARKRWRVLQGLDAATARRRLYAFLARRGYESSVVSRVTAQVLGGEAVDQALEAEE